MLEVCGEEITSGNQWVCCLPKGHLGTHRNANKYEWPVFESCCNVSGTRKHYLGSLSWSGPARALCGASVGSYQLGTEQEKAPMCKTCEKYRAKKDPDGRGREVLAR